MPRPDIATLVRGPALRRRLVTVPATYSLAGTFLATAPLWSGAALALDLAQHPQRLPRLRAMSMATAWSTLEAIGIAAAGGLWAVGRANDPAANYALQRWWAQRLVDAAKILGGLRLEIDGDDPIAPGPVVLVPRHSSIADTLIPVWLLARHDMRPRYVLKRELLIDPCLDIVGNRVPNHFVLRGSDATHDELRAIRVMTHGMGPQDGAVIYPEGTIATDERRSRALAHIAVDDPERARRLSSLTRVLPPRSAGLAAALAGSPDADVVFVDHDGLEPLANIAAAPRHLPLAKPVTMMLRRIARRDMPGDQGELRVWLDEIWIRLDRRQLNAPVEAPLRSRSRFESSDGERQAIPRLEPPITSRPQ